MQWALHRTDALSFPKRLGLGPPKTTICTFLPLHDIGSTLLIHSISYAFPLPPISVLLAHTSELLWETGKTISFAQVVG